MDERLLRNAKQAGERWTTALGTADDARHDYHHAVRLLHLGGGSLREIAEALNLSHQRVHQIVEGVPDGWKPRRRPANVLVCSFCARSSLEVTRLISGPGVFICDLCVPYARQSLATGETVHSGQIEFSVVPESRGLACSFCAMPTRLVTGPGVRLCDGCIRLCEEILTTVSS